MRKIADGEEYQVPSTLDDPSVLGEIEDYINVTGHHATWLIPA